MGDDLRLEVSKFIDLTCWRWGLTDSAGNFLADHEVRLDTSCWQFEAFGGLQQYVSWHAAPDQYHADEVRIVAQVGAWIGSEVFGLIIMSKLTKAAKRKPITVRVIVPQEAEELLFLPLEVAHVDGKPLARQDVTLIMQSGPNDAGYTAPVREQLQVLGLFSLPEGAQPLNLRRERQSLVELIHRIAASGKAAEVRVLQYGVTRDRLRDVLEDARGWDIIHISGHGAPGEMALETAAGGLDPVNASDLAELLRPAREHVKLVTVSACWSAGKTAAEQRKLLRIPIPENLSAERSSDGFGAHGTLATALTERLGCAVLAMRFPVYDDFAIALSADLYRLLIEKGQALPRAVGMTLRHLDKNGHTALAVATPAIFGGTAADLRLAAPPRRRSENDYDTGALKMPGFPPQPERFVGRTRVMASASAALAAESRAPGVLLRADSRSSRVRWPHARKLATSLAATRSRPASSFTVLPANQKN